MRPAPRVPLLCMALLAGSAANARAEDDPGPSIPVAEIGGVLPLGYRASHPDTSSPGNNVPSASGFGLGVRMDLSLIGGLLPWLMNLHGLRIGDFVGLEVGVSSAGNLVGHWIIGGQVSYEITRDIGVGVRAYSLTVFDHLFGSTSEDMYNNFIVGEATLRISHFVGRFRFPLATTRTAGAGYDSAAFGGSLRGPVPWSIMGHRGWNIGVDYDHLAYQSSTGDGVLHRLTGVLVITY